MARKLIVGDQVFTPPRPPEAKPPAPSIVEVPLNFARITSEMPLSTRCTCGHQWAAHTLYGDGVQEPCARPGCDCPTFTHALSALGTIGTIGTNVAHASDMVPIGSSAWSQARASSWVGMLELEPNVERSVPGLILPGVYRLTVNCTVLQGDEGLWIEAKTGDTGTGLYSMHTGDTRIVLVLQPITLPVGACFTLRLMHAGLGAVRSIPWRLERLQPISSTGVRCVVCGAFFDDVAGLSAHLASVHPALGTTPPVHAACPGCGEWFVHRLECSRWWSRGLIR